MKYKRWCRIFLAVVALFIGLNFLLWEVVTEDLLTDKHYAGGDLARMGYLARVKVPRTNHVDLPKRHLEVSDYAGQKIDVLTIGDSFSQGAAGGRNRYYQDYMASLSGVSVLNVGQYRGIDSITTVSIWCNNGYLDRLKPRYVLIEAAEKFSFDEFAQPIDFSRILSEEQLKGYRAKGGAGQMPEVSFINTGNFKFILYNLLYPISDHAFVGKVHVRHLKGDLFTTAEPSTLLFLKYKKFATADQIEALNRNLNTLSDKLAQKGIRLCFMPVVDKYNLYSEFIVDNPYPTSDFFEKLRPLPKRYIFVDTKKVLLDEVRRGEKDVFYADDTHWNWKASEAIFSRQLFR
ncbi:hypothetical protein GeomeDRAFT_1903 [Geobacter metallireducens RCH3]|uniref:AlgX/AlgJ SGNH hydrolase-like domain-containing protein n=1 Tax=Geobacter metallireducens (strain ATCC 53774 / DSM 7210 / GS-15) TaxID=269799 RepID=Q39T62_GEOMG|nr:hypothetical protein [Geobacter metallireducens]ABB32562.1 hypothetical protein Gmet_2337 [Geobacter metallireducens GS-15]EHP86411.1 hypothetical protein GeomeDRAFT_1903 [Geobacter metallireducens RCH3]